MSVNLNPESDLISEDELRTALRPYQIDAGNFEAGVRARIQIAEAERAHDPLAKAPRLLRAAAVLLPLPLLTGGKVAGSAAPLANASGLYKLLAYVALPAISLFVIPAAAVLGALRIRRIQNDNVAHVEDAQAMQEAAGLWWRQNWWLALLLYVSTFAMAFLGATALMLFVYLISLVAMLYVLKGFARLGIGNRQLIGGACITGLGFLGPVSIMANGTKEIQFVDKWLLPAIFFCGYAILSFIVARGRSIGSRLLIAVFQLTVAAVLVWFLIPVWRSTSIKPATPEQIKHFVESFDDAPNSSANWHNWEIAAKWSIDSKLDPDLSSPHELLEAEIEGEQNPFVLGSAFRVGLMRADQIGGLKKYAKLRRMLLDDPNHFWETRGISSLAQEDWIIRASVLRNDLSSKDRDYLERRLLINLAEMPTDPYRQLEEALRVTQLLEVIGRPIDRDRYRPQIHDMLREFHSKQQARGFEPAGGFKAYLNSNAGSLDATAYAVELMEIYGIPDDLDIHSVRSNLQRPKHYDHDFIAAVTLDRVNRLPGMPAAPRPTWLEYLYYTRTLIMAVLLVLLCIYATLSSPLSPRSSNVS